MVNREYLAMLENKSVIRELSEYANARGKEIGYDNVFDFIWSFTATIPHRATPGSRKESQLP